MGGALLDDLHHRGRCSNLGFGDQQVNVLRHHHISHDDEPITLAGLFQNREEAVAGVRCAEKRQPPVAGAGDKVQVMRTVTAMQAAGHNNSWYRQHRARPRRKREAGAPTVSEMGKEEPEGRATPPPTAVRAVWDKSYPTGTAELWLRRYNTLRTNHSRRKSTILAVPARRRPFQT